MAQPPSIRLQNDWLYEDSETGTTVGEIRVKGAPKHSTLSYSLEDLDGLFAINETTGVVSLVGSGLDYETTDSYTVSVTVNDGNGFTFCDYVPIFVRDVNEAPTIEAVPLTVSPTVAVGASSLFAVTDPEGKSPTRYQFRDDAGLGAIMYNGAVVPEGDIIGISRKELSQVSIISEGQVGNIGPILVRASDGPNWSEWTQLQLLFDTAPTDILLTSDNVDENSAIGTLVGVVTAEDPDVGDVHTFQLLDDAGGRFALDPNSGQLTVAGALDYESSASHDLTVRVTDGGGLTYDKVFTIAVNDVNEAPTDLFLSNDSVDENSAIGTLVGVVTAEDPDVGDVHTFQLLDDAGGRFALDPNSGELTVAGILDHESSASQDVTVRVTDSGGLTYDEQFTINITDVAESPPVIELSSLDGTNGLALKGINYGDGSGYSVSGAGDVNGDGYGDLVIGALWADPNGTSSGQSYVVFGGSGGWAASLDLSSLDGTNGFAINGINAGDESGYSVSGAGDVNGDGYGDLIIGAPGSNQNGTASGQSYVVFGGSGGWAASLDLSSLDGTNGFALNGINAGDESGISVSNAGDVNGDGYSDLIIGAHDSNQNGTASGQSYVVFGSSGGWAASLDLSSLDGTNGFAINGINAGDESGISVSGAGDVNGDGYGDLIIGAPYSDPKGITSGQSYVVFGSSGGWAASLDLSSLDGTNGFAINGINTGDYSGISVSGAGDVNGDGYSDLIIGAHYADPQAGNMSGQGYVVFGSSGGWGSSLDLSSLDGANGFAINGIGWGDCCGISVSNAGDLDGDGYADLIVGAYLANPNGADSGQSYVVFGHGGGWSSSLDLSSLDGTNGFALNGINAYDKSGYSVSGAGDVNGDGYGDLIIGGYGAPNGWQYGQSYVVFGQDYRGQVTHQGTAGDDVLLGTAGDDILIGGLGNDTLDGGPDGVDVLRGGAGNDTLYYGSLDRLMDGGSGVDTLLVAGSDVTLDLEDWAGTKITDIERIDITGSGDNSLVIGALEAVRLCDTTNTVVVDGDTGDSLYIRNMAEWTDMGVNGSYRTYAHNDTQATLVVNTLVDCKDI